MRVVDASIVLKWYVNEDDSEVADSLIGTDLIAPDLIVAELGNALWKKSVRSELGADQARAALGGVANIVSLLPSAVFAPRALEIALDLQHPVYDCFFLAAAEECSGQVITADRRLINRCVGTAYASLLTMLSSGRDKA